MITIQEICGALLTIAAILLLLGLGKRSKSSPMSVVYWCSYTGNQFITPVRCVDVAQVYANTLNISTISNAHIVRGGNTTHVLDNGVWSPVMS